MQHTNFSVAVEHHHCTLHLPTVWSSCSVVILQQLPQRVTTLTLHSFQQEHMQSEFFQRQRPSTTESAVVHARSSGRLSLNAIAHIWHLVARLQCRFAELNGRVLDTCDRLRLSKTGRNPLHASFPGERTECGRQSGLSVVTTAACRVRSVIHTRSRQQRCGEVAVLPTNWGMVSAF